MFQINGRRLRIGHYLPSVRLEDGGVVRAVVDTVSMFVAHGIDASLITGDLGGILATTSRQPKDLTSTVTPIAPTSGPLKLIPRSAAKSLPRLVAKFDVLHLHEVWTPSNLQLAAAARRAGVPYVLTTHGMLNDWSMAQRPTKKRLYLKLLGNKLLHHAAVIHCTAEAELDQGSRWYPRQKGRVIPPLIDLGTFEDLPGPAEANAIYPATTSSRPKILFLSRVHPKKGVERLIDAAHELDRRGIPCDLIIAGPGDPDYVATLKARSAKLHLHDRVSFLGMVSGRIKLSLYQSADVFVLPTSQENFGLVIVESMACRTPVVTTRGVDIWRELESAGATICDPSSLNIADAVSAMLGDRVGMATRGESGRRWVFDVFHPVRLTHAYSNMYAEALHQGTSRAQHEHE
jgi:glycosyltransferase involved in cell wall biosynthesis